MDETLFPKHRDRGTEGLDLFAPEPLCVICHASAVVPGTARCASCAYDGTSDAPADERPSTTPPHGHAA